MVHREQPVNISIQTSFSYKKEVLTLKRKNTVPLNVITLEDNSYSKNYRKNQAEHYPPWNRFTDFCPTDAKIMEGPINKRSLGHTCAFQIPRPILFFHCASRNSPSVFFTPALSTALPFANSHITYQMPCCVSQQLGGSPDARVKRTDKCFHHSNMANSILIRHRGAR